MKKAKNHLLSTSKCSESRVVSMSFFPPCDEVCVCIYVLRSVSFSIKRQGRLIKSQEGWIGREKGGKNGAI